MSDTRTATAQERKPPTLADIVREKTEDGRRIIDFFLDVMEDRINGAELCHRMDAARQLEKHRSKAAARFLAKYRGVPCGHSLRGRRDPDDPCSTADATGQENAPAPFTQDLLTVLSAIDEDLMARLVRAQTADGATVIEFLDDVMQDRNDGFRPHHRIAAAKELIVHIVRDEQPDTNTTVVPAEAGTHPSNPEPSSTVVPAEAGTHPSNPEPSSTVVPAEAGTHPLDPEPNSTVVPAKSLAPEQSGAGTQRSGEGRRSHPSPAHPEPVLSTVEGPAEGAPPEPVERTQDSTERPTRRRRTRTQRRRDGAARAAMLGKHPSSERNNEERQDKPAPVEFTIAERRIKERLEQHWHEPGPWDGPIDSASPGRSPPW